MRDLLFTQPLNRLETVLPHTDCDLLNQGTTNIRGVYVLPHPGEEVSKNWAENATQYGTDIYEVKKNPNTKVYLDSQDGALGSFFHKTIKHSDFNRTGHIFHNDEGHPQVHWHKEEECPEGRTANTSTHLSEQEFLSRHSDGL